MCITYHQNCKIKPDKHIKTSHPISLFDILRIYAEVHCMLDFKTDSTRIIRNYQEKVTDLLNTVQWGKGGLRNVFKRATKRGKNWKNCLKNKKPKPTKPKTSTKNQIGNILQRSLIEEQDVHAIERE